ncbi:MAG TPA: VTT domain-containing protein [Solirubrobacteraceae bacterium]|nr:VTT domain-containing protein [Solirubrobacteraceae bacterium]
MNRSGRRGIALTLLGVAALGALVFLVPPLRDAVGNVLSGDAGELRRELRDLGAAGALVLVGLMLVHAVLPFPSELINAAAGFAYGFWLAFPLVLAGWLLSAIATYAIGRGAARPALQRLAGEERLEEGARLIEQGGRTALLAARLIPIVPYSLVGYVAGAANVPFWRFTWTTVVGSAPLCAAVVYFGHRLDSLSVTDPGVLVAIGAFIGLLIGGRMLSARVRRRERSRAA